MRDAPPTLRLGAADELGTLIAIDDDASLLLDEIGLPMRLAEDHPFVLAEQARWAASLAQGLVIIAELGGTPVGFAALGAIDGDAYLDQLSVRRAAMRRGVGAALLALAMDLTRPAALWLTTYDHVAFNRPLYERRGFVVVSEPAWGLEIREEIADQRRVLPAPEHRVVMVLRGR